MEIIIRRFAAAELLEPISCTRTLSKFPVGGADLETALRERLAVFPEPGPVLSIADALWPSQQLAEKIRLCETELVVRDTDGTALAWVSENGKMPTGATELPLDENSIIIRYPWDLLAVNEYLLGEFNGDRILGTIRDGVNIDGCLRLGVGSIILPGVYIEGNVSIGRNCKIGPNCYFRGKTHVGDECHIGQAVEIKNSILMNGVSAGHLSYVGDSIIGENSNLGAGTITANFRHDGKNHRSMIDGELLDTGRRKFGTVLGDNVHTGIHTGIYPGRKIWPNCSTRPGEIVQKDITEPITKV